MPDWGEIFSDPTMQGRPPNPEFLALLPLIQPAGAKKVLDAGCGVGRQLLPLVAAGFTQAQGLIRTCGPNIGQLLFAARIDVEVVVLVVLADDHAFIDRNAGAHEKNATLFEAQKAVLHCITRAIGDQSA